MMRPRRHRRFHLIRDEDVTGISGTGIVAEGVEFTDGTTVLRWLSAGTARPDVVRPTTVVHESVASVLALHGHGGATRVEFLETVDGYDDDLADRRAGEALLAKLLEVRDLALAWSYYENDQRYSNELRAVLDGNHKYRSLLRPDENGDKQ